MPVFWNLCLPGLFLLIFSLAAHGQNFVPGEVIVKLKGKSGSISSHAFIGKMHFEKGMGLKKSIQGFNLHHFSLKQGDDVLAAVDELRRDPAVEYAEPNFILTKSSVDEDNAYQRFSLAELQDYLDDRDITGMEKLWMSITPLAETPIVVAVIDTGVDIAHRVFVNTGVTWINNDEIAGNKIDDDQNGFVDDVNGWNFNNDTSNVIDVEGHGTHVAGIILNQTQDIFATTLTGAVIRIMPVKFMSNGVGTTADAVSAIYYAVNNGAKVLNASWGGSSYSASLHEALTFSYEQHVIFVAAAGNVGTDNDAKPVYPANYDVPHIISVAAINDYNYLANFSNFGHMTVHIGSPGVAILSAYPGNTYGYSSGTSMAAPAVSGVAAMMLTQAPNLTGYQIKELVFSTGEKLDYLKNKIYTEAKLNIEGALYSTQNVKTSPWQPEYKSGRSPSSNVEFGSSTGCGLVGGGYGMGGTGKFPHTFFFVLVLTIPLIILFSFRKSGKNRRRYDRFLIDSAVTVSVDGHQLVGTVSSISLGGVRLDTDAMLDRGGIVSMKISSPDGNDQVEVQGQVVWQDVGKYGIQFANVRESTLEKIAFWTRSLMRMT